MKSRPPITKEEISPSREWRKQFFNAIDVTYQLLDELAECGFKYKKIKEVWFIKRPEPAWQGLTDSEGRVEIDPSRHESRAVAHEIGHGFDECWRKDDIPERGESMAETIRYFVEERMGQSTWQCPEDRTKILCFCKNNFQIFKSKLSGDDFYKLYR